MTTAQAAALRYVGIVTGALPYTADYTAPRRDTLGRLVEAGLITVTSKATRDRNADRWSFDWTTDLTDAGRTALAAL